jgi:hypothetical protein
MSRKCFILLCFSLFSVAYTYKKSGYKCNYILKIDLFGGQWYDRNQLAEQQMTVLSVEQNRMCNRSMGYSIVQKKERVEKRRTFSMYCLNCDSHDLRDFCN